MCGRTIKVTKEPEGHDFDSVCHASFTLAMTQQLVEAELPFQSHLHTDPTKMWPFAAL